MKQNKKKKQIRCLLYISMVTALALSLVRTGRLPVRAEGDVHYLVFASDYRSAQNRIETSMSGMPSNVEYVSLIGDMAGETAGDHPKYKSSEILTHVQNVFPKLDNKSVSVIWADHDSSVSDKGTDIVKGKGGYESGLIYTGKNSDGSKAYYIYSIGFNHMTDGGGASAQAASAFKSWVKKTDPSIPVIVVSHVPLQALRGDNNGALYWSEALNYAATGTEGIVSTGQSGTTIRNVLFLSGHNYTADPEEYYFAAGSTMDVQIDPEGGELQSYANGLSVHSVSVYDEELKGYTKGRGVTTNIYYTAMTPGYLKTNGNASLVEINDKNIVIRKYNSVKPVSAGADGKTKEKLDEVVTIQRFVVETKGKDGSVSVKNTDESGKPLDGAVFTLYDGNGNTVASYDSAEFKISTKDEVLTDILPDGGKSVQLTLRQTQVPAGYKGSDQPYLVKITAEGDKTLEGHTYKNDVIYTVTIDGQEELEVQNTPLQAYTIRIESGDNGKVIVNDKDYTGSGSVQARENTRLQFRVIPDDGYETEKVYYNDNDVTSGLQGDVYTLTVSGEGTLKVTFMNTQEEEPAGKPEGPSEQKNTLNDLILYGGISAGGLVIALILVIILRARDKHREK